MANISISELPSEATSVSGNDLLLLSKNSTDGSLYTSMKLKINSLKNSLITIDNALSTTSTNAVENKVITNALNDKASKDVVTTTSNGLMSSSDKSKLDGVATGATKITVDTAMSGTSTNPVQNKVINASIETLKNSIKQLNEEISLMNLDSIIVDLQYCTSFSTMSEPITMQEDFLLWFTEVDVPVTTSNSFFLFLGDNIHNIIPLYECKIEDEYEVSRTPLGKRFIVKAGEWYIHANTSSISYKGCYIPLSKCKLPTIGTAS